ncbi:hypothetical protein CEK25_009207 [Fusarium fujikuroi]|nr:hypothetical protein CEK25_009207 [Fusarium fujikuroi]
MAPIRASVPVYETGNACGLYIADQQRCTEEATHDENPPAVLPGTHVRQAYGDIGYGDECKQLDALDEDLQIIWHTLKRVIDSRR